MEVSMKIRNPEYVMISSDFSQQEPKLTAFVANEHHLIKAFQEGRDVYATLASIAFNTTYENCLEFNPDTGEYQPDGKKRRNEAKTILLGITYGRSVPSIGQQLYGHDDSMSEEEKTKQAQYVYDSVMKAFPDIERFMRQAQAFAKKHGYVETILGRRRHLPDMTLEPFEFEPLPEYVNPNIDPLDPESLTESGIPEERIKQLKQEFSKLKYFGQIMKRTRQLYENEHIRVINNKPKINDARRQCVNCVDEFTEILTLEGWKTYSEVKTGDKILSYSMESNSLVFDEIQDVIISEEETEALELKTSAFNSVCTLNHRWIMENFDTKKIKVYQASKFLKVHRPRYHILRISNNNLNSANVLNSEEDLLEFSKSIIENSINCSEIFKLSYNDANNVYSFILTHYSNKGHVIFEEKKSADIFQMLCIMSGKCCNMSIVKSKTGKKYKVTCSKKPLNRTARIDLMKKNTTKINKVWCVSTNSTTWIARRNGCYYITGNSIIQGSAADFTKSALLTVSNDKRWRECGGQILTVVHDEIVAQVPLDRWEDGANVLKSDMENSGSFLPFPIKCDVTATYRWYGLEIPCKWDKPDTLENLTESEIKWVQWNLVEMGYELPTFKDENGDDPIGDAAHGVSGRISDTFYESISDYCNRYNIEKVDFINNIDQRVQSGLVISE